MKNLKLSVLALLVSVSTIFAQESEPQMEDVVVSTEVMKDVVEEGNNDEHTIKQYEWTEEFTPFMLDPEDRYELNQDVIYMPTQVTKTIKLDFDEDKFYEKEVKFSYEKSKNFDLDFTLTRDGIIILTDKPNVYVKRMRDNKTNLDYTNIKSNRIKKEGDYTISFSNGEKIVIKISDYEIL